jgi:signal peptide peptidase SppA
MTSRFPHLAQRLFNTPIAILPGKAEVVMAALADRFGVTKLFRQDGRMVAMEDDYDDRPGAWVPPEMRPPEVIAGVCHIPIEGTLVQKLGTLRPYSGMTGYDGIRTNIATALADPEVDAIALDINSPGGEVSGCFDLAEAIYAARGRKPIWAILSECAFSAAYAIASAADRITVPRTGGTGSVGVICMHVDLSKALTAAGLTVTLITYGARKADGTETAPLSKVALDRIQADIDVCGEMFVNLVARNRGLTPAAVRATEAATYLGAEGVRIGFADAVSAPDAAFADLLKSL